MKRLLIAVICVSLVLLLTNGCATLKTDESTISGDDIDTLIMLKGETMVVLDYVALLYKEQRPPTEAEMIAMEARATADIAMFYKVMERVAESYGKTSMAYKILEEILKRVI